MTTYEKVKRELQNNPKTWLITGVAGFIGSNLLEALLKLKLKYPDAEVIAHPECMENLLDLADFIGSTSKLLLHAQTSDATSFIVLTEPGILHQMQKMIPNKTFIDVPGLDGCSCNTCPYMRMNTNLPVPSSSIVPNSLYSFCLISLKRNPNR